MPKVCLNKCFVVHLSVLGTPYILDITLKFVYSLDKFVDLKNPIKSYPAGGGGGSIFWYFGPRGIVLETIPFIFSSSVGELKNNG